MAEIFLEFNPWEGSYNFWPYLCQLARADVDMFLPSRRAKVFADYLIDLDAESAKRISLIDVKYNQTHHLDGAGRAVNEMPRFLMLLQSENLPTIHLLRKNLLKIFLSHKNREHLNKAALFVTDPDSREPFTVNIELPKLQYFLQEKSAEVSMVSRYMEKFRNCITIEYEDMFDPGTGKLSKATAARIEGLLGVDGLSELAPTLRKMTSDHLRDVIVNYEEVACALKHSPHAWMLDE